MKKRGIEFLICIICTCLFAGGIISGIRRQQRAVPDNPMGEISAHSSLVAYLGKGYEMERAFGGEEGAEEEAPLSLTELPEEEDSEEEPQEEQSEEPSEIEEAEPDDAAEPDLFSGDSVPGEGEEGQETLEPEFDGGEDPETIQYEEGEDWESEVPERTDEADDNSNPGAEVPDDFTDPEPDVPEENLYPEIYSDLTDGEVVDGSYRTFYVQAVDHNGQYLSSSMLTVTGNGERLYAASDTGEMSSYRLDLMDGENQILIQAADYEGRTVTVTYQILKGENQTEPAGTITFSLEATTVGLGYLIGPMTVPYYEGEQLSYVMDRAIQENGFTYRYDGSLSGGFYLKHIIRGNLTQGFHIPDDLYARLEAENCPMTDYHLDSLGEFDFTRNSGWLYFVNGEYMNSGISTYYPADGDVVRVRFSLYGGADVGCSVNGEAWGDW